MQVFAQMERPLVLNGALIQCIGPFADMVSLVAWVRKNASVFDALPDDNSLSVVTMHAPDTVSHLINAQPAKDQDNAS